MSDAGEVQSFQGGSVKPQRHGDHDDHHASFPSSERQNASGANALYKTDQPEQELAAGLPGATERKEGQGIQQHSEEGTADSTGAGSGFGGQQAGASKEALQGPQCAAPKERYEFEMKMDEAKGRLTGSKSCQYFALSSTSSYASKSWILTHTSQCWSRRQQGATATGTAAIPAGIPPARTIIS